MKKIPSLIGIATLIAAACPLFAQSSATTNLDALLERVEQNKILESKENEQRIQRFLSQQAQQKELLAQAKAELAAAKDLSIQLKNSYDENELTLADLETQRENEMGDLGEIFGNVRQLAGQFKNIVSSSLTSSQFPGRAQFFADLGESKALPTIEELNKLWFQILQETVESGKVARYQAKVVNTDGIESTQEVVRVGTFNALNSKGFLDYVQETGQLAELAEQPKARYTAPSIAFVEGDSQSVVIDPSQGALLQAFANTPDLSDRVNQGGEVGYVIISLLCIGIIISIYRWITLTLVQTKMKAQLKDLSKAGSNPVGRIIKVFQEYDRPDVGVETLELKIDEAILKETPKLESGLSTIKILSAIAPLLGLLGTVVGMIATFQSITLFGTGDPKLMAGGISQALVTTVLGLICAIPLVLIHSFLQGISNRCIAIIEEQSAGLIASFSEKSAK
ncbi:MotA/TolQ/ExbB proton channel family protein [Pelagicoccus albus]|uniref:MotA/TolQ/ExbB proton channel family protein n=1 Tax=Pelagicoccus albus TaxID=415222 RepID=A0A7X1E9X0_9BACT|nr:MotA/TolQ/ExbB proton channel family protein [Pelagicoccus albus]MBC2607806.1 MotA/TolQ/ExbB proton channel family protein [Pelagicoccus albus]